MERRCRRIRHACYNIAFKWTGSRQENNNTQTTVHQTLIVALKFITHFENISVTLAIYCCPIRFSLPARYTTSLDQGSTNLLAHLSVCSCSHFSTLGLAIFLLSSLNWDHLVISSSINPSTLSRANTRTLSETVI